MQYTVGDSDLAYFQGERATVLICAQSLAGCRQLCQLTFNRKSGAVYAQFTYFKAGKGVVGRIRSSIQADLSSRVEFAQTGLVTSNLVKYSHPPNGRAHFSQDGHVITKVWADAVPLTGPQGHLFEIHAFGLDSFEPLIAGKEKRDRIYLPFATEESPGAATVAVEWRRKKELVEFARAVGRRVGPIGDIPRRRDGQLFKAALFGPPPTSGLRDHVLAIGVGIHQPPKGVSMPTLILMGGWKYPPQRIAPNTQLEYLAFMYPIPDHADFAKRLESIDLPNEPK